MENVFLQQYFRLGQQEWKDVVIEFMASYKQKEASESNPQEIPTEKCSVSELIRRSLSKAELKSSDNAVRANLLYAGLAIRALLLVSYIWNS